MFKPESFQEKEIYKILWDKINHLIPARRPNQVFFNKKKNLSGRFWCSIKAQKKNERNQKDLVRELKRLWIDDTNCSWCSWNGPLVKRMKGLEIRVWIRAIQMRALLRLTRKLKRVQESRKLQSLRLQWKTISWCRYEKLERMKW